MDMDSLAGLFSMTSGTKEEAFLKGVLFGFGAYSAHPAPGWELVQESPEMFKIEKEIWDMFEEIHRRDIAEVEKLLAKMRRE